MTAVVTRDWEGARTSLAAGDPQRALRHLDRATRLQPENRHGWRRYGLVLTSVGRYRAAERVMQRARALRETVLIANAG